ncbi:DUF1570 domain-containing protein [Bremerella sp. T1]|uniref:DUF1570 domain-containing protein n=1 Tax=Bremerella sp. TYQ1 TaxID=3119568 RepID=UPI001CC91717|nr:DUF1570 domain-containing protein [Bremerella volcania]UBM37316.1 DUF1570 domain-containing protein [Bremerella volcania]
MAFLSKHAKKLTGLMLCIAVVFAQGCMMWSNRVQQPPTTFVDDVPLKIEADFDLQDDSQVLQEVRNLKMELRDDLGIPFSNDKIHVRIFRDAGTFSDFTSRHFPQLNGRRALFVVERGEYYVYAIWSENVLSDLRHELTHAYLNSSVGTLPLWLDEGLAEYYEVAGVPGRLNREHIPWLSDGNQRGTWQPDLERLASISKPEQMTGTDYAEAWLWVHYLMQNQQSAIVRDYLVARREKTIVDPIPLAIRNSIPNAEIKLAEHINTSYPLDKPRLE